MEVANASPICTFQEVADLVGMPESTLRSWAKPTKARSPLVHTVKNDRRGWPTIPLAGLVEARSLRALRDMVSMQQIAPAVQALREETGDEFVLAKPRLFVSTAGELYEKTDDVFVRLKDKQIQVPHILDEYMRSIEMNPDGSLRRYRIPLGGAAMLFIDPRLNAGRPSFSNGVPAFAVLGAYDSGDSPYEIAEDFGVSLAEIEATVERRETFAA